MGYRFARRGFPFQSPGNYFALAVEGVRYAELIACIGLVSRLSIRMDPKHCAGTIPDEPFGFFQAATTMVHRHVASSWHAG